MIGNGNPNKLPGIPTGARPKVVANNFDRGNSMGSNNAKKGNYGKTLGYQELVSGSKQPGSSSYIMDEQGPDMINSQANHLAPPGVYN